MNAIIGLLTSRRSLTARANFGVLASLIPFSFDGGDSIARLRRTRIRYDSRSSTYDVVRYSFGVVIGTRQVVVARVEVNEHLPRQVVTNSRFPVQAEYRLISFGIELYD